MLLTDITNDVDTYFVIETDATVMLGILHSPVPHVVVQFQELEGIC